MLVFETTTGAHPNLTNIWDLRGINNCAMALACVNGDLFKQGGSEIVDHGTGSQVRA